MTRGERPVPPERPLVLADLAETPLVSVLIANYNYAGYVGQAIESALGQTYPHLEVVVCDDASTDASLQVIEAIALRDDRVKLVAKEANGGMASATNAAFAACSGDIVCLLDSDDYLLPQKLEKVIEQFQKEPSTGLLVHPLMVVDSDGTEVQQIPLLTQFEHGWIAERMIRRGGRWREMPTTALCFRREPAEYVFPIPEEDFRRAADGFTFTLLPLLTEVSAVEEPLAMYRVHGANDHLALGFHEEVVQAEKSFVEVQNRTVNKRLEEILGKPGPLRLERHVGYQQKIFLLNLLGSRPWKDVLRSYARFVRLLIPDDLYRPAHKILIGLVFGIAALLPRSLRGRWLGVAISHNRFKQMIRGGLHRIRAGASWLRAMFAGKMSGASPAAPGSGAGTGRGPATVRSEKQLDSEG